MIMIKKKIIIKCSGSGYVLDVPESNAKEGAQLITYDIHGGDNQVWNITDEGRISSELNTDMVLVKDSDNNVVLGKNRDDDSDKWKLEEKGVIRNLSAPALVMTDCCGRVKMLAEQEQCPEQSWSLETLESLRIHEAQPATSCHLKYPLPVSVDTCSDWELRCEVTVRQSTPATYFCVIGWAPGGYSGIRVIKETI